MFGNQRLLIFAGIVVAAIVLVIAIARVTSPGASSPDVVRSDARCAVAREALKAFDQGRAPPPEWIQDRDAAAKAVRDCERT